MSDYNKRLLGISVGAIFYIIFFLLEWWDLTRHFEINLNQDRSFLFELFDTTNQRKEDKIQMLWTMLSIIWIGGFWFFRDVVGNFIFSIFQWIKGKI